MTAWAAVLVPHEASDQVLLRDHGQKFGVFRHAGIRHLDAATTTARKLIKRNPALDQLGVRIAHGGQQNADFLQPLARVFVVTWVG